MPGMPWCSATQYRRKPSCSTRRTSAVLCCQRRGGGGSGADGHEVEHGERHHVGCNPDPRAGSSRPPIGSTRMLGCAATEWGIDEWRLERSTRHSPSCWPRSGAHGPPALVDGRTGAVLGAAGAAAADDVARAGPAGRAGRSAAVGRRRDGRSGAGHPALGARAAGGRGARVVPARAAGPDRGDLAAARRANWPSAARHRRAAVRAGRGPAPPGRSCRCRPGCRPPAGPAGAGRAGPGGPAAGAQRRELAVLALGRSVDAAAADPGPGRRGTACRVARPTRRRPHRCCARPGPPTPTRCAGC